MRERRSGEREKKLSGQKVFHRLWRREKKKNKNVSHSNDGAVVGWEILFTAMQNLSDEKKKKSHLGKMRRRGLRTGGSRRQTGWGRIAVHMTPLHVTMPVLIRFSSSQLSFFFSLSWLCSIIGRDLGSSLKRVHCAAALSPANELLWPNQRRFFFFEAFRFLMWIDSICDGKWHGNGNELYVSLHI